VDFDDPVSKFLPSFAAAGKASVTLSHWDPQIAGELYDGPPLSYIEPGAYRSIHGARKGYCQTACVP